MVATARLFNASVHDAEAIGDIVGYYCGKTVKGYYTANSSSRGYWFGNGANHLGLEGEVKREDLFYLLRGKHHDTKRPLVRLQKNTGDKIRKEGQDRCGLDLTFSVPKSVSLLWALSSPELKKIIEDCVLSAVEKTLLQIEEHCPLVRAGKGGNEWKKGKLIAALFMHFTARNENDPGIHVHVVLPNVAVTEDGTTQKINTRALLPHTRIEGPLFRNTALAELDENLGVRAYIPKHGEKQSEWFELKGMDRKLLREFSSRRREIEEETSLLGYSNASSAATQYANFATRRPKGEEVPIEDLLEGWEQKAMKLGFTKQMVQKMIGHSVSPVSPTEIESVIGEAIRQISKHEAVFDRWELVRKTSELLQDRPVTGAEVISGVDQYLTQSQDIVVAKQLERDVLYSTKEMARLEDETIQFVNQMASRTGLAVSPKNMERAIRESKPKLSEEQERCVRSVLSASGSIASIAGFAGAGKTTVLRVITRAYELDGKRVIGVAVGGVAVDKVKESINRECRTFASLLREFTLPRERKLAASLKHHARMVARAARKKSTWKQKQRPQEIDSNVVLLPDESGMIDLLTMHPFLKEANLRNASVLFMGDQAQLAPVGPGNPMVHVDAHVLAGELKQNWRQTEVEAEASLAVREGNSAEALKRYADKGDLVIAKTREDVVKRIVSDWAEVARMNPKDAVVLAQTNREVAFLNRLCQSERLKHRAIGGSSIEANGYSFYRKDRVIFRGTDKLLGVKNGHRGEVISIGEDGSLLIKIDGKTHAPTLRERLKTGLLNRVSDRSLVKLTAAHAAKLDLRLGYASTTHSYQGSQTDRVFVLLGGKYQDRRISYVQLSRSTFRARLYVDRPHAGPELSSIIKSMDEATIKQNVRDVSPAHELEHKRKK